MRESLLLSTKRFHSSGDTFAFTQVLERFQEHELLKQPSHDTNATSSKEPTITSDRWLIVTGIATAICSAAFAAIMISQNSNSETFKGTEKQDIFARAVPVQANLVEVHTNNSDHGSSEDRKIDYDVTSSISTQSVKTAQRSTPLASDIGGSKESSDSNVSNTYSLIFVHKDVALLRSSQGFVVAKRGTILPKAGKVLSIERLGDMWIVVTPTRTFVKRGMGSVEKFDR